MAITKIIVKQIIIQVILSEININILKISRPTELLG